MEAISNDIAVKGFFHLQIVDPDGTIAGDSGRFKNVVTLLGFQQICLNVGTGLTGTKFAFVNVGEGTAPASGATALQSECSGTNGVVQRQAPTASTLAGSLTLRHLATMASNNSFVTQDESISNVGLFMHSDNANSLVAGAAYASSTVGTNQAVQITYDLVFNTA